MGSPLSPVVVDFLIDSFEAEMLGLAPLKPIFYRCYMDATLLVWPHAFFQQMLTNKFSSL